MIALPDTVFTMYYVKILYINVSSFNPKNSMVWTLLLYSLDR
jgi:hypothetical protein